MKDIQKVSVVVYLPAEDESSAINAAMAALRVLGDDGRPYRAVLAEYDDDRGLV